jgi:1-phosphofructokinase
MAAKPNVIKPNVHELSEILGEPLHYQRDVIAAARQIALQGVEYVVVSMGADGALFVTKDHIFRGSGVKVPVVSTVGAGDAMLAAILYHLQSGCSWEETAKWSIATGAANVMCEGSLVPTREQIASLFDQVRLEQLL